MGQISACSGVGRVGDRDCWTFVFMASNTMYGSGTCAYWQRVRISQRNTLSFGCRSLPSETIVSMRHFFSPSETTSNVLYYRYELASQTSLVLYDCIFEGLYWKAASDLQMRNLKAFQVTDVFKTVLFCVYDSAYLLMVCSGGIYTTASNRCGVPMLKFTF